MCSYMVLVLLARLIPKQIFDTSNSLQVAGMLVLYPHADAPATVLKVNMTLGSDPFTLSASNATQCKRTAQTQCAAISDAVGISMVP